MKKQNTQIEQVSRITTYTRQQAASMLNMGLRTIDAHLAARRIGFCKIGGKVLILPRHIETFLSTNSVEQL